MVKPPQAILIVDTDSGFLGRIGELLIQEGHVVQCVDNVLACLNILERQQPDILFVDFLMPYLGGDDLCRAIRNHAHLQEAYVVLVSGVAMEHPLDIYSFGADAYIAKGPWAEMQIHILEVVREAQNPNREYPLQQLRGGEGLYAREVTRELLKQNQHLKHLLRNMSQGIIEIVENRVVYVNARGSEMLNIAAHEIIGARTATSLPRALLDVLDRQGLRDDPKPTLDSANMVQFNNRQFIVENLQLRHERAGQIVILSDITERKRMESVIEAANLTENIGFIFSGIRHEIGNPVNSIKMALSVLRRNLHEYDLVTVEEFLDRSLEEISRIEYLLKALKNYSLFESPVVQDLSVTSFLTDFIALVRSDFHKHGIRINTILPDNTLYLRADSRALHHVLLNLLTNAADALAETGHPQITISGYRRGDSVVLKVDDNGKGIDQGDHDHLFKPFFTTKTTGTGLGLAIVKKMLTSMQGTINIESYLGIGTTVTILLPGVADGQ